MSSAMVALANLTLGSAQATVTFSSIPATYRDLRLVVQGYNSSGSYQDFGMRFNADSGANYSRVYMAGNGSSALSGSTTSDTYSVSLFVSGSSTDPSALTADIMDYSATDKHKTILARNSGAGASAAAVASRWANSASAITSVVCMTTSGANWAAGSTFALYGVLS